MGDDCARLLSEAVGQARSTANSCLVVAEQLRMLEARPSELRCDCVSVAEIPNRGFFREVYSSSVVITRVGKNYYWHLTFQSFYQRDSIWCGTTTD
jgi:hypothetical protein